MNHRNTMKWRFAAGLLLAILLILFMSLLSGLRQVQATNGGPQWSTNAMACTPNGSTIANSLVQTSHGHARFSDGKTGDLYLICPFSDATLHGTGVKTIAMQYVSNGSGKVSVALRRMDRQSGDISNLLEIGTATGCPANATPAGSKWSVCQGGATALQSLDFNRYYYYVQLSLNRANAADVVQIAGVTIW